MIPRTDGIGTSDVPGVPPGVLVRHAVPPLRPALADLHVLPPAERHRAERIRVPAAAARHVTGRALLRRLLAEVLAVGPRDVLLQVEPGGRLTVLGSRGPRVSVAHTDGMVVVAAAATAVGIDVERADRWPLPPAPAWLSPREQHLLDADRHDTDVHDQADHDDDDRRRLVRTWTAKEATAKALGRGLTRPLARIEVAGATAHVATAVPGEPATWRLHDLAIVSTHVVTLALPNEPWSTEEGHSSGR